MTLAGYMADRNLDDEQMAAKIRKNGTGCDRSTVSRWRRGLQRPDWPMIARIAAVTDGSVTANDWVDLEAAE